MIARETRSEDGRARASFLQALQGAEVDSVSDMVQKSFLSSRLFRTRTYVRSTLAAPRCLSETLMPTENNLFAITG